MTKKEIEDKAAELFPLPDKKYYEGAGEAFILETAIIKQRQKDYVAGGIYVKEKLFSKIMDRPDKNK